MVEWLAGLLAFLPAGLAAFAVFVPAGAGFAVFCAGFPAAFFAVEEAEPAVAASEPELADPLVDCAATGRTAITQDNKTAMQREASCAAGVGDFMNLMPSLYAAFGHV